MANLWTRAYKREGEHPSILHGMLGEVRRQGPLVREEIYEAIGGAWELFGCSDSEVLIEGPAGTGKSRAVMEKIFFYAERNPGSRYLMLRKTRASMSESILPIWERDVVWEEHECLTGPTRAHRHSYLFGNGSEVVLGGMDNPDRIMSSEYDMIAFFEATEFISDDYEKACTRLRNHRIPHPDGGGRFLEQAIIDCNPSHELHWINRRALDGRVRRILSRHEDNPTVTEEYLEKLRNLTGVRKARLYLGQWVSAEGQIWEDFDPAVHMIDRVPVDANGDSVIRWYFASCDWGFKNPGVMQVWGVDGDRRAYRVHEIYMTRKDPDWWADHAVRLNRTYDFRSIICDPAEPARIDMFNRRMRKAGGRNCAFRADNSWIAGTNVVRERMTHNPAQGIVPGVYLLRGARESVDRDLADRLEPTCTEEEIPGYVYREIKDGHQLKEEADPGAADHGCLPAGTGILMPDGTETPIERVSAGDLIQTPHGPRTVEDARLTHFDAPIWAVELSDGRAIHATPNHRFWVDRGKVRVDALRYGDMMAATETGFWPEQHPPAFVQSDAGRPTAEQVASMTKSGNVWPADWRSSATDTQKPTLALVYVLGVYPALHEGGSPRRENVYNLTVEGERAYIANGVVSWNCDAMRYAIMWLDATNYSPEMGERSLRYRDRPGTLGHALGVGDTLREIAAGKYL